MAMAIMTAEEWSRRNYVAWNEFALDLVRIEADAGRMTAEQLRDAEIKIKARIKEGKERSHD
jgi:hypothetical protein